MAAAPSQMKMEDCHGHGSEADRAAAPEKSSHDDGDCHDTGCSDCVVVSAFDGAKEDSFVSPTSVTLDPFVPAQSADAAIPNLTLLVAATHPLRGPPPFIRETLVSLFILLLN